jgi:hypothetical protein
MTLREKLIQVYEEIDHIEKLGTNSKQNYSYVRAADMVRAVRKTLLKLKVYAEINMVNERQYTIARAKDVNAPFNAVDVRCTIVFHDAESEEMLTSSGLGTGADTGDKAIYKAQTGAIKYALRNSFLVPDEADPEADPVVDGAPEPEGYSPAEPPDFQDARHAAPRAPAAAAAPAQRVLETTDVPLGPAQPENAPASAGPSQPVPSTGTQQSSGAAPAAAPSQMKNAQAAADDTLPTEEELTQYRKAFSTLGDDLTAKGKLKSSKGLPVNRKLLAFLLFITGAAEAKSITKAQWDDFFQRVDHVKGLEDGLVGLAKLVNKANGVEEKK